MNGEYRGDSDLGKLMHDFNCPQADDMNFELMADRTRYLKENPKGVNEMCRIMEDMRKESLQEGIKEGAVNTAKKMLADGTIALEKISEFVDLSIDEVKKIKAGQTI